MKRSRPNATRTRWGLTILLVVAIAPTARAVFDPLTVSPRTRGMGGPIVAVTPDAWSFANNPAALPLLEDAKISVSTTEPNGGDFNRLSSIGGSFRLGKGVQGVSLGFRDYGVEFGGNDLLAERTLTLSHGFQLFKDASTGATAGWALNFYNVDFGRSIGLSGDGSDGIDPGSDWAVGLDLAAMVEIWQRTRVGFVIKNVNNPTLGVDKEQILAETGIGIAYEPYDGVLTAFDIRSRSGEAFRFFGGLEVAIIRFLDLRAGLESNPNKLTAGFGVNVPWITVDYAFSTGGGVLDSTHQFGLTYRFGGRKP